MRPFLKFFILMSGSFLGAECERRGALGSWFIFLLVVSLVLLLVVLSRNLGRFQQCKDIWGCPGQILLWCISAGPVGQTFRL